MTAGERIRVRGLVQGVGFRPTVWRIATGLGLLGQVINDGDGVLIETWGTPAAIDSLCERLRSSCPPLARIDAIERAPLPAAVPMPTGFRIGHSAGGAVHTGIVPDAATCPACRAEVIDPGDRRFRYPFTNCTHCGPRLSIVRGIPYDRANTSMGVFTQCPACQAEYDDPADRRFHAQPNACPACGPRIWLQADGVTGARDDAALAGAVAALAQGAIVALKGIGGFHLVCDAGSETAVRTLRERKGRYAKPFALMADSIATIARYVVLDDQERALLEGPAAPIVLAARRDDAPPLAGGIAPGQARLGFMLPYSPLHHLLLSDWAARQPGMPLVMTSGNRSDEPQCTANEEAGQRLSQIADLWLLHDREIVNRVDDSVVRVDRGRPRLLRRARGYAPAPLALPPGLADAPPLLALGAELKNTFCLLQGGQAIVSQHLGDLEDARTSDAWEGSLQLYRALFEHRPAAIVVDRHPGYRSTRHGRELAAAGGLPLLTVQHHHAHIASVLADNGWPLDGGAVLGIALDGLGLGDDGTLWGGEFLLADYRDGRRLAHLPSVPLPGGTRAMQEPWRNTWAQLHHRLGWDTVQREAAGSELLSWLERQPLATLEAMVARGLNSPPSSACGRLFDAVAGALGVCRERIHYEGQAAIELENLAAQADDEDGAYPFTLDAEILDTAPMWRALLHDLRAGTGVARVAARFHNGLADAIVASAGLLCRGHGLDTVALSGGVFQNRHLFSRVDAGLADAGLRVLSHRQLPANDGGIAFGQAVVGAARLLGGIATN